MPELAGAGPVIAKMSFDACAEPAFLDTVAGDRELVICGCEAHVCLMQTALGALERGYDVHVLADASGSRKAANKEIGLARLRQAGAIISATELTIYEWMVRSDSDDFRALRNLLK